jgi:hypothetical protein
MAKTTVFLVHGVGKQTKGWSTKKDGPVAALTTAAKRYACFKDRPLTDQINFVEIRYDDIFDGVLEGWSDLAAQLEADAGGLLTGGSLQVLDDLKEGDENTFAQYGGDVLLYRFFPVYTKAVLLRVMAQITAEVAKGDAVDYGLVAHSLGTTVAHDALHILAEGTWQGTSLMAEDDDLEKAGITGEQTAIDKVFALDRDNPFAPGSSRFRWFSIMMIANTSPLLHVTRKDPYSSNVRCGVHNDTGSISHLFYDVDHRLDPICWVKPFTKSETHWTVDPVEVTLDHIYDYNVHGFAHYLMHPAVHGPLFRDLAPDWTFACTDKAKELSGAFPRIGNKIKSDAESALASLTRKAQAESSVGTLLAIYRTLKDLKEKTT